MDDGTGQLILEASVGGGVPALQQAQRGQDAGGGTDGGHLPARLGKGGTGLGDRLVGGKVGCARDPAGQNDHVHTGIIHFLGQRIGGQVDLMAAHQLPAAHGRGHDDLHLGAA